MVAVCVVYVVVFHIYLIRAAFQVVLCVPLRTKSPKLSEMRFSGFKNRRESEENATILGVMEVS